MARTEHIVSLPNALTLIRLPMAALLWLRVGEPWWIAGMVAAAGLSDVLDGSVARWIRRRRLDRGEDPGVIGESHAVGAWLDPLCDKTFAVSAMAAIVVGWMPPLWIPALILAREALLVPFIIGYHLVPNLRRRFHFDFQASKIGKAATVVQFAAFCSIALVPAAQLPLAFAAGAIGVAAAVSYLRRALATARYITHHPLSYERWLEVQRELHGRVRSRGAGP